MASHTTPATSNDYSSFSSYSGPQPFVGIVENTIEAMHLVYAASKGIVPRTARRLASNAERRNLIKSGAVFIFSVKESGIRRWTDGRQWSASRVAGNFLVSDKALYTSLVNAPSISQLYRELAEKKSNVKDFDRFEELILADGVVYSDAPNRYASSSRKSVASTGENNVQKLKDDGLRKKVRRCYGPYHIKFRFLKKRLRPSQSKSTMSIFTLSAIILSVIGIMESYPDYRLTLI